MGFIWQLADWPRFHYDLKPLVPALLELTKARASLVEKVQALGLPARADLTAEALCLDALSTARIEGEELPAASVRSSIARRLGLDRAGLPAPARDVEGLVAMLDDATRQFDRPLTDERLFGWHAALFPSGFSQLQRIVVGAWRNEGIAVQSGSLDRAEVHFEAPPALEVPAAMTEYLDWWNGTQVEDSAIRAGLAHLWFETIHPFDDGNGRIGRAIADMALAAGDGLQRRYYSLSSQFLLERDDYYRHIEAAQRGTLDVTEWLAWFLGCTARAVAAAATGVDVALLRVKLRESVQDAGLNVRQLKVIHGLIEHEPDGFTGGLTNAKYRGITGASKATATRDLADLLNRGLLVQGDARGRSAHYHLALRC